MVTTERSGRDGIWGLLEIRGGHSRRTRTTIMVDGFDRATQLGPARARHWIDLRTPDTSDPRAHTQNPPGA